METESTSVSSARMARNAWRGLAGRPHASWRRVSCVLSGAQSSPPVARVCSMAMSERRAATTSSASCTGHCATRLAWTPPARAARRSPIDLWTKEGCRTLDVHSLDQFPPHESNLGGSGESQGCSRRLQAQILLNLKTPAVTRIEKNDWTLLSEAPAALLAWVALVAPCSLCTASAATSSMRMSGTSS